MANELGLRNVAFEVNDLQAALDWAATEGYGLVAGRLSPGAAVDIDDYLGPGLAAEPALIDFAD